MSEGGPEGDEAAATSPRGRPEAPSFKDATRFWIKLGFINFGGPTGQIAIMHEELVEKRRWVDGGHFFHALNYCMLLPGPEAQQLAVYVGWLLHGVPGGLVAGIAFILPAFFLILGLSYSYVTYGDIGWVSSVFFGLQAAVVGIVAAAAIRIGARVLRNAAMVTVAAAAFAAIFLLHVPFPFIVLGAGLLGLLGGARWPGTFAVVWEGEDPTADAPADRLPHRRGPALLGAARTLGIGLAVWLGPLLVVGLVRGPDDVLREEAAFFSKAALVTFGGAYAVLAYINEAAVHVYRWLEPGQMVAGLGLAESTPGPLIMVIEFVGFVGAYRQPGGLDPWVAGVLGAVVSTWATFAPCFLWIFLSAGWIERLRGNLRLSGALSTITGAVVGVVLSLAVRFGAQTLFGTVREIDLLGGPVPSPDLSTVSPFALAVAAAAFLALWKLRWGIVPIVAAGAVAGLIRAFV